MHPSISVIPGVGFAGLVVCLIVLAVRRNKLAAGFLSAARAQALPSRVNVTLNAGKYPKLRLGAPAMDRGQFEVRRKGSADRLVEGLGLAETIRSFDPAFGDRFHVDSDDEAFASAFFSDMGKRAAVEALFAAGCTSLVWGAGRVTAVWLGFRPKDANVDFVGAAAASIRALTINVPAVASAPVVAGMTEKRFDAYAKAARAVGLFLSCGIFGFCHSLPGRPVNIQTLFLVSLRVSVPLAALFVLSCLPLARGKSWFLKAAGQMIAASLLLFPAMGYAGYAWVNSFFDAGPSSDYVLPVVQKYSRSGRYVDYHEVTLAPWRPGLSKPRFQVGSSTFRGIRPGRTRAHLTTRPGRLGHEWIVSLSFSN